MPWHQKPVPQILHELESNGEEGLDAKTVQQRLEADGPNSLQEAPLPSFWALLLDQFRDFLVIILIVASVLSFALGDTIEGVAIVAIVILNATIGVVQESRAEGALRALSKLAAPQAEVIRNGQPEMAPAQDLVRGDIVLLQAGSRVPADLRLIEAHNLRTDEASLTGESHPVAKHADTLVDSHVPLGDLRNLAFMGTSVAYGRGKGVVIATGMHTQIGLIARMIQAFESEPTPLQKRLDKLGRTLGWIALAVCGIVFLTGWIEGRPALTMLITAVSLAIAAVPEGLAAVVTICLALGMQRMVHRHALLRRLPAVEALGSTTVICSDKTGTLTQNAMTVIHLYTAVGEVRITGQGYDPAGKFQRVGRKGISELGPVVRHLLRIGAYCNDARLVASGESHGQRTWHMHGDPTEGALLTAARKGGVDIETLLKRHPRLGEVPFTAERKLMTTLHPARRGCYALYTKGAPEQVLMRCSHILDQQGVRPLLEVDREGALAANRRMASSALRVLGFAYRPLDKVPPNIDEALEQEMIFVGLQGMIDPPRPEVAPAVALAKQAGIRSVMITGDYQETAVAVAREIGLLEGFDPVLTGADLDAMSDEELAAAATHTAVYARTSPHHKLRIVDALKRLGHIVAMTGDGVNDAPALKRADIGIAMGITGTDVAKETSAMVLTDDNYASIVSAVEEGRTIYNNIRKFVGYLLSCNVSEILVVFLATLLNWPLPLTAIQLLVLNLVTDGAPALALGLERAEPGIMERPPRPPEEPMIDRLMTRSIIVQGVTMTAATLLAFRLGLLWHHNNLAWAQTLAFVTLSLSQLSRAYTSRSEVLPLRKLGILGNRAMQWACLSSLAVTLLIIYVPFLDPIFGTVAPDLRDWGLMLGLILIPSIAAEVAKLWPQPRPHRREAKQAI